ncbi:MAG: 2,3-bisphosphoglycerate-independent phosphoglycerate mutase [Parcubacteria group bacterium Athens1014_10]|nr:MAG: 2,3-bisphosphoglycerate-independent phosphoglycerate mutase [Parcubacteria group bacterium Athens1014_10]TSD05130.1 MAG: 2,3-bisphosphoglycerate-independent phosphoglycerate mutase [Parcubacteria group bacterium Athens0714_12]
MINQTKRPKPVVLIILDGWGLAPASKGNAISLAKPENTDYFWDNYPHTTLKAHGKYVGLPDEQDGNSEAGHLNLGAGRTVLQDSVYIFQSIKDGTFFKNAAFIEAISHLKKHKTKIHLMGLLTEEQSPHASLDHLLSLLELVKINKLEPVCLHLFTDGRDSSQHGAIKFLKKLKDGFKNGEVISSVSGRFYAMDRKKDWNNIEKVYNALVLGEGEKVESPEEALLHAYNKGLTDEYVPPSIVVKNNKPVGLIEDNDAIIFFNLRSDRARELTKAFVQKNFNQLNPDAFKRKKIPQNIRFVAMTDFGPDLPDVFSAFPSRDVINSLPFALNGLKQLYIAETEKFAHVTYFFNGGYADPVAGEERIKIPSLKINHYDQKPEMSAYEITKTVKEKIKIDEYDFILINFANPDMIGHTGNLEAGIKACKITDECAGEIARKVLEKNGTAIITADHGNAEEMIDLKTNEIDTGHSANLVPFIIVKKGLKNKKIKLTEGTLGDVAPTILDLMGINKPKEMKGKSLLNPNI